jgi:hypothetical protein
MVLGTHRRWVAVGRELAARVAAMPSCQPGR